MLRVFYSKFATLKMMLKHIGGLMIILGITMSVPFIVSLIYLEFYTAQSFLYSGLICISLGQLMKTKIQSTQELLHRHALIVAALGWLVISFTGSIPFVITAYITPVHIAQHFVPNGETYMSSLYFFKNPLHAMFESVSGFTTTGLSMAVHEPSIGKGLLFYRHYCQLLGGAGFIVLTLAVLRQSNGKIAYLLYGSESTGERLKPSIIETARSIWKVYLGITFFCFLYLVIGTYIILPEYSFSENIFDSINHAMAGMSTGGFSTLDDSIAGYKSKAMENLYLLPMILGSLSLPFYVKFIESRKISMFWKNLQTRAILLYSIAGSIILSLLLLHSGVISEPFRTGIFQFVSALSTTGWQTADAHLWNSSSVLYIVIGGMIIGGAAGATVGGVKIIRVLFLFKGIFWQINGYFSSEQSIKVVRFNERRLLPDEMNKELALAATYIFMYLLLLLGGTLITFFIMDKGFTLKDALYESASAQGTVGLSCGITHPAMNPFLEITYIFQMWAGRLEIIPVLVLIRTLFLGSKPVIV